MNKFILNCSLTA